MSEVILAFGFITYLSENLSLFVEKIDAFICEVLNFPS